MNSPEQTAYAIGNFQLQSQLANHSGQSLSVTGYIFSDDDEQKLNNRLDTYKRIIDRQQKISEIPLLEAKINGLRDALKQHEQMHKDFLDKQERGEKIPSQEKLNSKNLLVNMRHFMDQIAQGEQAISKLKQEVG